MIEDHLNLAAVGHYALYVALAVVWGLLCMAYGCWLSRAAKQDRLTDSRRPSFAVYDPSAAWMICENCGVQRQMHHSSSDKCPNPYEQHLAGNSPTLLAAATLFKPVDAEVWSRVCLGESWAVKNRAFSGVLVQVLPAPPIVSPLLG